MLITSGPPGIEVPHLWNAYSFNNRKARPRVMVRKITGWGSLPEADAEFVQNTGRSGELKRPGFNRGRTLVYEGVIESRTLEGLRATSNAFKTALRGFRFTPGVMTMVDKDLPYIFSATVEAYECDDEQTRSAASIFPYAREFILTLRVLDGKYYQAGVVTSGDRASGSNYTMTNQGNCPTSPVMVVKGMNAGGTASVWNATIPGTYSSGYTGLMVTLPTGVNGDVTFDFANRTITVGAAKTDISGYLTAGSDWWDPGKIGVGVGANQLGASGGTWNASFFHAFE